MTDADKPAFVTVFAKLATALREQRTDAHEMSVFFERLKDLEIEFVTAAADRLSARAQFFPKVAEWRQMAATIETERREQQRAYLRKLPAPLCPDCSDTGMKENPTTKRYARCDCQQQRRLELLGRRTLATRLEGMGTTSIRRGRNDHA